MNRIVIILLLIGLVGAFALRGDRDDEARGDEITGIYNASTGRVEKLPKIHRTDAEWKKLLTPEQYRVTRMKGTELPGTCSRLPDAANGLFQCVGCGTDLFKLDRKFESGTGWPSFWGPVSEHNVRYETDTSLGMTRTEVLCARCDAHLGHVFDDGPPPHNKRYCINSVSLRPAPRVEKATFALGCFWGSESAFRALIGKGVVSTRVGYTGGRTKNPTYKDVCTGRTGHAESVEVTFDPAKISYRHLLGVFWESHNPHRSDGQGPDIGSQYRAAVFYHTPEQKKLAETSRAALQRKSGKRIATEIVAAAEFYPAEEYHQRYYEKKGMAPACPVY